MEVRFTRWIVKEVSKLQYTVHDNCTTSMPLLILVVLGTWVRQIRYHTSVTISSSVLSWDTPKYSVSSLTYVKLRYTLLFSDRQNSSLRCVRTNIKIFWWDRYHTSYLTTVRSYLCLSGPFSVTVPIHYTPYSIIWVSEKLRTEKVYSRYAGRRSPNSRDLGRKE